MSHGPCLICQFLFVGKCNFVETEDAETNTEIVFVASAITGSCESQIPELATM